MRGLVRNVIFMAKAETAGLSSLDTGWAAIHDLTEVRKSCWPWHSEEAGLDGSVRVYMVHIGGVS